MVERLLDPKTAHCHIKASNTPKEGAELFIGPDEVKVTVQGRHENLFVVEFSQPILEVLDLYGALPIPPYFNREAEAIDTERYQTVFNDPTKLGYQLQHQQQAYILMKRYSKNWQSKGIQ